MPFIAGCSKSQGKVEIVNKSNEIVAGGTLKISDQIFQLPELPIGKTFEVLYKINSDSNYSLQISFKSGRKISKDVGYVTYGFSLIHDQIIILDNDISLLNKETK